MRPDDIKVALGEDWKKVEGYIGTSLSSDIKLLDSTNKTILSHSGKQLRPLISLLVASACSQGHPTEDSYRYAAATELLHNATLLHDDVADGSDERRGVPTIRSLMGPSVSVLVGDYWLVKSMELILSSESQGNRVIRLFSETLSDLAEGEMLQLQKAGSGDTELRDYLRIIYNKTASLFVAGASSAAISVGASERTEQAAVSYAEALGMAFQIRDDIFDYSPGLDVGKPTGVDILEQKITLPLLGAMSSAPEEEAVRIRGLVAGIKEHPEHRDCIMAFVDRYAGVEHAETILREYSDRAAASIDILPDSWYKECLKEIACYVGERMK